MTFVSVRLDGLSADGLSIGWMFGRTPFPFYPVQFLTGALPPKKQMASPYIYTYIYIYICIYIESGEHVPMFPRTCSIVLRKLLSLWPSLYEPKNMVFGQLSMCYDPRQRFGALWNMPCGSYTNVVCA